MYTLQFALIVSALMTVVFIPKAEAGFNILGMELGGSDFCSPPALKETLKCPVQQMDKFFNMPDEAIMAEARTTTDTCRMVNLVHEFEMRFPIIPPALGKATYPHSQLITAQLLRINKLIEGKHFEDALYWIANYRIEHVYATKGSAPPTKVQLDKTMDALMSKAWDLYREGDFCDAAKALGTFDINESTHFSINRPNKWRESRFLQLAAFFRGEFFNEVRTASRKYRQVELIRMHQAKIREKGEGDKKKILADLALYFEAQAYFMQIPRPENVQNRSILAKLKIVELDPNTLGSKLAEKALENMIKLVEGYPKSPIVKEEGWPVQAVSAQTFTKVLGSELFIELEDIFKYGGTLKDKTIFAYDWLARKEIEIGRYYLHYKQAGTLIFDGEINYRAAALRFNGFLNRFPNSKHKPEALFLLSYAFYGMEDYEQEQQTVELMEEVFPGNEFTIRAREEYESRERFFRSRK